MDGVYRKHLQDSLYLRNFVLNDKSEEFYKDYQINRNLSYIKNQKDYFILLFPYDSDNLTSQATSVLGTKKHTKFPNATTIDWKAMCRACLVASKKTRFHTHFEAFFNKYLNF